jgi:hypothetical protein
MVAPKFTLNFGETLYFTCGETKTPNKLPFPELKPKLVPISKPKLTFLFTDGGGKTGLKLKGLTTEESWIAAAGRVSGEF